MEELKTSTWSDGSEDDLVRELLDDESPFLVAPHEMMIMSQYNSSPSNESAINQFVSVEPTIDDIDNALPVTNCKHNLHPDMSQARISILEKGWSKVENKYTLKIKSCGGSGMSDDGYKWRKYGQKFIKNSPFPRNPSNNQYFSSNSSSSSSYPSPPTSPSSLSWSPNYYSPCFNDRDVGEVLVKSLQNTKYSIDEKLDKSFITLFGKKVNISKAPSDQEDAHRSVDQINGVEPAELDSDEESDAEDLHGSEISNKDKTRQKDLTSKTVNDDSDEENNNENNRKEHIEFHDGRMRRKAVFGDEADHDHLKDLGDDEDDDEDDFLHSDFSEDGKDHDANGEKYKSHQKSNAGDDDSQKDDDTKIEERRIKKLALRAKFDAQYPSLERLSYFCPLPIFSLFYFMIMLVIIMLVHEPLWK
ncbi:putative WRKY transcription factor 49 [Camellia lanceoleosa]|uniref:WRKY transcription factor 49 n=1 Tax=Camellia lanceoleosa TaxID=1840588 RepID=A0ACC0G587_9ERIC|nr:putative WRKY transcription factor 49 [Camellia lanceoleosa]